MADGDPACAAFGREQVDDPLAGIVAEKLAEMLLVKTDAVAAHQLDEALRRVAAQRATSEARVLGEIPQRVRAVEVGEVAAAAAGDTDLLAEPGGMIQQQDFQTTLPRDARAEQAGGTGADDGQIESFHRPMIDWPDAGARYRNLL